VAEWRWRKGWSDEELAARLEAASRSRPSFSEEWEEMTPEHGWRHSFSEAMIGREPPGQPVAGGALERSWQAITLYEFSDPRIITAHFDPAGALLGRRMLLEAHVLGLRYLGSVRVGAVREEEQDGETIRGFRYDTLEGHFESGSEWFLLAKEHRSGEVWFRIQAAWRPGQLPNGWSRFGFRVLARKYQRAWHRLAYLRLREIVGRHELPPLQEPGRLLHEGPELLPLPLGRFFWKHASPRTRRQLGGEHALREQE
jgi:uncharacterized protein (UPF0548 family)